MNYGWVESNIYEPIPSNAVWCSKDKDSADVYIGKYAVENSVVAVKIIPRKKHAFACHIGRETPVLNYLVLVYNREIYHIWVHVSDAHLPSYAVQCGYDTKKNKLLVGRAFHKGYLIPGYVHSVTKVIHIPYEGKEYKYSEYEVLISLETISSTF